MPSGIPELPSPSRRGLMKSTAWAVPAITLTTAAPAFAVSSSKVTFTITEFSGTELPKIGNDVIAVTDVAVLNSSDVDLPAGQLVVTISTPAEWGPAQGWDVSSTSPLSLTAPWIITYGARSVVFTSRDGYNAIPANTEWDPLAASRDWQWTTAETDSDEAPLVTITISTLDTSLSEPISMTKRVVLGAWSRLSASV